MPAVRGIRAAAAAIVALAALPALVVPGRADASPMPVTSRFVAAGPVRVADTRLGQAPAGDGLDGVVAPGGVARVQVAGALGVDATDVTAAVLNVTITEAVAPGYVQVLPGDSGVIGAASNLNIDAAGQTIANQVTVPVGADGTVRVYLQGGGHVVVDVFGYYTPSGVTTSGRFEPVAAPSPRRVLDTRDSVPLTAGGTVRVAVPGSASAVVANVTVTEAAGPGYWQVVPTGGSTPLGASSNLNVTRAGQTIANQVVVPVGADGSVTIFSQAGGHVVVDVAGVFTNGAGVASTIGLFVPIDPSRLADTRDAGNTPVVGPIAPGAGIDVAVAGRFGISLSASGVALNVTATEPTEPGYVRVVPAQAPSTGVATSVLNIERPGQTIANASYATLGDNGAVTISTLRSSQLIADAAGWFTGGDRAASPRFAFVGTYNQGIADPTPGIRSYQFDPASGALTFRSEVASSSPSFLALHPNGRYVYAVNELDAGTVEAYRIEPLTGGLTLLDRRSVGSNPTHVVVDPTGSSVIVANYTSGTFSVVAIDADGGLGAVTDTVVRTGSGPNIRQQSSHAHGAAFAPGTNLMATANLGTDQVELFRLVAGRLVSTASVSIAPGGGPRHVVFSADGTRLYIVNELTANIIVYAVNPVSGTFGNFLQTIALMPPSFVASYPNQLSGAEILIHPSGDYLYASHRGYVSDPLADSIVRFRIDRATGLLTRLGQTTTGLDVVRSMTFDPSGTWLYALNQDGDTVERFAVDWASGDLVFGAFTGTRSPVSMVVQP